MIRKKADTCYRQHGWQRKTNRKNRYRHFIQREFQPMETRRLVKLRKELKKLSNFSNSEPRKIIAWNLEFFDIISRFQDDGYLKYQPPEKKHICKLFNSLIAQCGHQTDWNHSKKGERITNQNIVYGGILNLPMKPAIYWLNLPRSCKIECNVYPMFSDITKSSTTATKKFWITELLANSAVKNFTRENIKKLLCCIEELL